MKNRIIDETINSSVTELENSLEEIRESKKLSFTEVFGIKSKIRAIIINKDRLINNFKSKNKELELEIKEKDYLIKEKDKTIIEKDRVIIEKDKHIERLEKRDIENKKRETWTIVVAAIIMILSALSSENNFETATAVFEFILNILGM